MSWWKDRLMLRSAALKPCALSTILIRPAHRHIKFLLACISNSMPACMSQPVRCAVTQLVEVCRLMRCTPPGSGGPALRLSRPSCDARRPAQHCFQPLLLCPAIGGFVRSTCVGVVRSLPSSAMRCQPGSEGPEQRLSRPSCDARRPAQHCSQILFLSQRLVAFEDSKRNMFGRSQIPSLSCDTLPAWMRGPRAALVGARCDARGPAQLQFYFQPLLLCLATGSFVRLTCAGAVISLQTSALPFHLQQGPRAVLVKAQLQCKKTCMAQDRAQEGLQAGRHAWLVQYARCLHATL